MKNVNSLEEFLPRYLLSAWSTPQGEINPFISAINQGITKVDDSIYRIMGTFSDTNTHPKIIKHLLCSFGFLTESINDRERLSLFSSLSQFLQSPDHPDTVMKLGEVYVKARKIYRGTHYRSTKVPNSDNFTSTFKVGIKQSEKEILTIVTNTKPDPARSQEFVHNIEKLTRGKFTIQVLTTSSKAASQPTHPICNVNFTLDQNRRLANVTL